MWLAWGHGARRPEGPGIEPRLSDCGPRAGTTSTLPLSLNPMSRPAGEQTCIRREMDKWNQRQYKGSPG